MLSLESEQVDELLRLYRDEMVETTSLSVYSWN